MAALTACLMSNPVRGEEPPAAPGEESPASGLLDPTKPDIAAAGPEMAAGKGPLNLGPMRVNLILQGREHNLALINGKRYREGERIGPALVKKVDETGVILAVDEVEQLVRRDSCFRLDERGPEKRAVVQVTECGGGGASDLIRLQKKGNQLLINALVNDKEKVTFILDTGATITNLPRDIATRAMDPETFKLMKAGHLPKLKVKLANGDTAKAWLVTLQTLKLGEVELKNVEVSVAEDAEASALLGVNVLDRLQAQIDTHRGLLIVGRRP